MSTITARIGTNLLAMIGLSVLIIIVSFVRYSTDGGFEEAYLVSVEMPEAGGVLPFQEVTVLGRAVGQVDDVRLSENGVTIDLLIAAGNQVPASSVVQVLRRSPIGEQAVDFQPETPDWTAAEPGSTVEVTDAIVPAEVPFLLDRTVQLFSAIDTDDLATVVHELAVALDGRGPTLVELGRDSLDLNRTLVAGIPELERLNTSSAEILRTLADGSSTIAESLQAAAELTELLAAEQPTLESLLDTSPVALSEAKVLVEDQSANLGCLMGDLISLNGMLTGPSTWDGTSDVGRYDDPSRYDTFYGGKLQELSEGLRLHRSFFQNGFAILGQPDYSRGIYWNRILLVTDQGGGGEMYPEKRATPTTRPGAACVSEEFGLGVNAVRQADARAPHETVADLNGDGRITTADIDFAPLVDGERNRGTGVVAPVLDTDDDGGLAATGGGALVLAPMLLGLALVLRRRR